MDLNGEKKPLMKGWMLKSPPFTTESSKILFFRRPKPLRPRWKRRFFVLYRIGSGATSSVGSSSDHCLIYYKDKQQTRVKGSVDLRHACNIVTHVTPPDGLMSDVPSRLVRDMFAGAAVDQLPFFQLEAQHKSQTRTYFFLPDSARLMDDWAKHVSRACGFCEAEGDSEPNTPVPSAPGSRGPQFGLQNTLLQTQAPAPAAPPPLPPHRPPQLPPTRPVVSKADASTTATAIAKNLEATVYQSPAQLLQESESERVDSNSIYGVPPPPPPQAKKVQLPGAGAATSQGDGDDDGDGSDDDDDVYKLPPQQPAPPKPPPRKSLQPPSGAAAGSSERSPLSPPQHSDAAALRHHPRSAADTVVDKDSHERQLVAATARRSVLSRVFTQRVVAPAPYRPPPPLQIRSPSPPSSPETLSPPLSPLPLPTRSKRRGSRKKHRRGERGRQGADSTDGGGESVDGGEDSSSGTLSDSSSSSATSNSADFLVEPTSPSGGEEEVASQDGGGGGVAELPLAYAQLDFGAVSRNNRLGDVGDNSVASTNRGAAPAPLEYAEIVGPSGDSGRWRRGNKS